MIKSILAYIGAGVILYALYVACIQIPARISTLERGLTITMKSVDMLDSLSTLRYDASIRTDVALYNKITTKRRAK